MKKIIIVALCCFIILAALAGVAVVATALATQSGATPQPLMQAQQAGDTASIYFSDLYQAEGILPLHTWQPITVFGETFHACVVEHVGSRSTLTVNPDDSRVCGDL